MNINKLRKIDLIELVKILQLDKIKIDTELLLTKHKLKASEELIERLKREQQMKSLE